jgi:ElaB/YqjD/DUF883 family membrane-anchored ribosome-binding protein
MAAEGSEKLAPVEDVLREVSRIKSLITEAVEDGVRSAVRVIQRGRYAAEDVIEEAKHTVKKQPFPAMGVVFSAGVLTGCLLTWIASRRR